MTVFIVVPKEFETVSQFFDKLSASKQCQKLSTVQFRSIPYAFLASVSISSLTMLGKGGTLEAFGLKSAVPNIKSQGQMMTDRLMKKIVVQMTARFFKSPSQKKTIQNKWLTEFSWLRVDQGKMFCPFSPILKMFSTIPRTNLNF